MRLLIHLIFLNTYLWAQPAEDPRFTASLETYKNKDFFKTIQLLIPLVKDHPQRSIYWFNLANSQFMLKKYNAAIAGFNKVISLNGNFSDISIIYKAKALKKLGQHEEASGLLEKLDLKPSLTKGIKALLVAEIEELDEISFVEGEALKFYRTGQWSKCESSLVTLDLENLSLNGRLLFGLSLMRQKKYIEADQFLQIQINVLSLPPAQRKIFSDLLKKARQNDKTMSPKWLFFETSYGQTSNVYFDGLSRTALASSVFKSILGAGYHFNSQNKTSQKIGYTLNYEQPKAATELTTYSHTIQGFLNLNESTRDFSASLYFVSQNIDNSLASEKLGSNFKTVYTYDQTDLSLEIDLSKIESKNQSLSVLRGSAFSLRPAFGFWGQTTYGQLYISLGRDQVEDLNYTDGSRLPLGQDYYGLGFSGLWKFSQKGILSMGTSIIQHQFKNLELPDSKTRSDQEINLFLKLNYYVYHDMAVYIIGEQINNRSSLGIEDVWDKNYNVNIITTGFVWDVY